MKAFNTNFLAAVLMGIALGIPPAAVAAERYTGPMMDAHGHLGASFDWATINKVMDRNTISRQVVMACYYPGPAGFADRPGDDELTAALASRYPGRFFLLVGMQRPELTGADKWHHPAATVEAILNQTETKLGTGRFRGVGEVAVRGADSGDT